MGEQVAAIGAGGDIAAVDQDVGIAGQVRSKHLQLCGIFAQVADVECFVTKDDLARAAVRDDMNRVVGATTFEIFCDLLAAVAVGVEQQELAAGRAGCCDLLPVGNSFVNDHQCMRRTRIVGGWRRDYCRRCNVGNRRFGFCRGGVMVFQ